MMGPITWLVLRTGLSRRSVIAAMIGFGVLAAILAWNLWLADHDEEVIAGHEQTVEGRLQTQGRAADQNLADRAADDLAAQGKAREEFDNATAHLPKSGLTARQRVDACDELRAAGTDQAILARAKCL